MTPLTIPAYPRRLSLITLLYGIGVFMWLQPEDSVWLAVLLGAGLAGIGAAHLVFNRLGGRTLRARVWFPGMVALGGGVGAGAALLTVALMIVKTALHNHIYADYPPGVLFGIAARLPAWALAGLLSGLAAALIRSGRSDRER